ncbi:DnaA regulatory inactivator Hda [Eoetvoesiella caeni]
MTQQLILDLLAAPPPSLDNFIVGENGAALDALRNFAPGRAIYLWGPSGAGRSHLLKALAAGPSAHYFNAQSPAGAMRTLASSEALPLALAAVDDVHLLDEPAQAELFALYNRWRETAASDKAFALLVAGDRAPLAMPLREDLRTRLGWDLVFRLEQLSDDDRANALRTQAGERGLQLSPEVIGWILTHYARDMGQLSALVDALDRYSLEKHRAITLPLLKDLLATSQPQS